MAFSFNFDIKVKTDECCQGHAKAEKYQEPCIKTVEDGTPPKLLNAAREHTLPTELDSLLRDVVMETVRVGALPPVFCVNESVLEHTAEEREEEEGGEEQILRKMAAQRSDLIPGVYEGGLRVWECTYDLLEHLEAGGVTFSGRRVLDLGCGAGLLGVMAMRLGAELVHFQDYNSTVIQQLTIPNAVLNQQSDDSEEEEEEEEKGKGKGKGKNKICKEAEKEERKEKDEQKGKDEQNEKDEKENHQKEKEREERNTKQRVDQKRRKREGEEEDESGDRCDAPPPKRRAPPAIGPCRFFSGDWVSFLSLLRQDSPAHKYDIILTSETIYNTAYYEALHEVFRWLLADDGQVLLATKAHYFGVGGGLLLFERFVEQKGVFEMRPLLDVDEGLQRHVVSLRFRRKNTHVSHSTATDGAARKMT